MGKENLKGKILCWQKVKNLEENLKIAQNNLAEEIKETKKLERELFQDIVELIENLLEGRLVGSKEIKFSPPGRFDGRESRWVYAFWMRDDGMLEIVIAENDGIEGEVEFYTVIYDLGSESLHFKEETR